MTDKEQQAMETASEHNFDRDIDHSQPHDPTDMERELDRLNEEFSEENDDSEAYDRYAEATNVHGCRGCGVDLRHHSHLPDCENAPEDDSWPTILNEPSSAWFGG